MHRLRWLLLIFPLLAVAGIGYQWAGAWIDKKKYLALGRLVDVGDGCRLYFLEMGAETAVAGPTVIFESGIAATSLNWVAMQEADGPGVHSVLYDRAGLGWSSSTRLARTPANIVVELRTLLRKAGIAPPYLLVGHSFGGMVVRSFAAQHAEEVAGVILIDAMRCEDWPPLNEARRAQIERGLRLAAIARPIAFFGVARLATTSALCRSGAISRVLSRAAGKDGLQLVNRITGEIVKMPRKVWPIVAAHWSSPRFYRGLAAHLRGVPATVREMLDADPIAGVPVLHLTAANSAPLSEYARLRIGPDARQVVVENSGHWIHLDQPVLVLRAVREMLEHARLEMLKR